MSQILKSIYENIERGKRGENKGLYMGFDRLAYHICNIQKRTYYLLGGSTGSGKTAMLDNVFLFSPYDYLKATPDDPTKLEVIYYSLEIPPDEKIAKLMARKLWEDKKILTFTNEIFSKGNHKASSEVLKALDDYRPYVEELLGSTLFFRESLSPDYLYKDLMDYYEKRGTIIRGAPSEEDKKGVVTDYKPNNPNLFTIVIIDHIGLIDGNQKDKGVKKAAIDRLSRLLVWFRNKFATTVVVSSQFNRGLEGMDRRSNDYVIPQLADFKESGNTQEDANIVMALFYPYRFGIEDFLGYDITKLKKRFRSLHLLKNRDGEDSLTLGMHFIGEIGNFKEMPTPQELAETPGLYQKILDYGNIKK